MKFSSQEEYGLRCLLQLARRHHEEPPVTSITEISRAEGLSVAHVAKLMRLLRTAGFVDSVRGQEGGYTLSRPPAEIAVMDVLAALGGRFYEEGFCTKYPGSEESCTHTVTCSIRPLWTRVQRAIDAELHSVSLTDLLEPTMPGRQTYAIHLPRIPSQA